MSPPRKYPIQNHDKKTLGTQKYQCLTSDVPLFSSGIKSLRNEGNDENPETTDISRTDKDDTSHTNLYDFIENVKDMKKTNDDYKYQEEN